MNSHECTEKGIRELLGAYELGLLTEAESTLVEDHLLICDTCFNDLYDTAPMNQLQYMRPAKQHRRNWMIPVTLAAVLLLAFTATFYIIQTESNVKRGSYSLEDPIKLLTPQGIVEKKPVHFRWESPSEFFFYNLIVFNEEGDSIWSTRITDQVGTVDVVSTITFEVNKTYFWKVEGVTESERPVLTSPVYSFSLKPD